MSGELNKLTEDEAALYDRQIRLWGLDAQRRLRASTVLLAGVRGLGAEVAKNIVLAGVHSLTLLDHTNVSEEDRCSNFVVDHADLGHNYELEGTWGTGRPRVLWCQLVQRDMQECGLSQEDATIHRAEKALQNTQKLNPMVIVSADTGDIATKPEEYFDQFDVVCVLCNTHDVCIRINDICRRNKAKFFAGDVFGFYGYMFADLGTHEYAHNAIKHVKRTATSEDGAVHETITTVVKKVSQFLPLCDVLKYDWSSETAKMKLKKTPNTYFLIFVLLEFQKKFSRRPSVSNLCNDRRELLAIRDDLMERMGLCPDTVCDAFTQRCFAELSPVCAIVGGILAQEVIKAVSHKDMPHNNFFFYNGDDGFGMVDRIGD